MIQWAIPGSLIFKEGRISLKSDKYSAEPTTSRNSEDVGQSDWLVGFYCIPTLVGYLMTNTSSPPLHLYMVWK